MIDGTEYIERLREEIESLKADLTEEKAFHAGDLRALEVAARDLESTIGQLHREHECVEQANRALATLKQVRDEAAKLNPCPTNLAEALAAGAEGGR